MKCPKCGFNSFEFLDNCKKCGVSLASFKKGIGINPIVFAPAHLQMETQLLQAADVPNGDSFLQPAPLVQAEDDTEETFTWDIPALSETTPDADTKFSGFDLDFINDDEKPKESEAVFSFNDEPVVDSPDLPAMKPADSLEEFSFYENTLELGDEPLSEDNQEEPSGSDFFGETGVIGEITPEQLQAVDRELELTDRIEEVPVEASGFDSEFVWEDLASELEKSADKEMKVKKEPLDIPTFEKDFESIFLDDDAQDSGKSGN